MRCRLRRFSRWGPAGPRLHPQYRESRWYEQNAADDIILPNGKSQKDAILQAEHAQSLKDAARLVELSEQLKQDLEKSNAFVLPLAAIRKTDELERLVKKIRSRLRRN